MSKQPALWFSETGDRLSYIAFNDTAVPEIKLPIYSEPDSFELYTEHVILRYPTVLRLNYLNNYLHSCHVAKKYMSHYFVMTLQPSSMIPRVTLRVIDLVEKDSVKDVRPPLSIRDQ